MSAAERMRFYRGRKRDGLPPPDQTKTKRIRALARHYATSPRSIYYAQAISRDALIDWPTEIFNIGKRGERPTLAFVAEICAVGDETVQKHILWALRTMGYRQARCEWERLK